MARKLCSICNHRSVGAGTAEDDRDHARTMGYCGPCLTEADWENVHSDDGHDEDNTDGNCWECHPELNRANDRTSPRTGHTNTVAKSRTSHASHHHPRTPDARAACRKSMAAGTGPLDLRTKK